ncbi:MAG: PIN domain-containing protein [Betaproteobacteria bacterium]|nr:PIN domain-containing protein [Betaproteobacteria bacterium]
MRCFFDTNVLVYSRDPDDAAKRAHARALIEKSIEEESFVVSTQVLVEFYATSVRRRLLGPAQALDLVRFWGGHDTVPHTPDLVVRGLELHQAHSFSVWDGLIVQAALDARCDVLLSEDLQHGRRFGDLEVANPFLPAAAHEAPARAYGPTRATARSRKSRRT